ncbi:MAG: hypothetical protein KJO95_03300 [Gammaproteobacteria bacterium]|nr:hypothetical protein [Gammaproteobacteria bacterium]MBU2676548.1 hypothetical protein [Gammaproteobacteria bacterium]NNC57524.1 hypothetical protein [Woeseiaceae bacterium]NNL50284.1 hypothetical protein [Woeseiaceae bacterium]
MRRPFLILLLVSACSDAGQAPGLMPVVIGKLENPVIREASGLARSQRQDNVLWIINDNGAGEWVHAINPRGKRLGEFDLKKSDNKDWEDLASFRLDDKPYLLVADIGDNDARHKTRTLYIVEEPGVEKKEKATVDWRIDFRYPDGPRDAEAAAVDIENRRALVLTKRNIPPALYEVPLLRQKKKATAKWLGTITSLPAPSRQDVEFAPKTNDWHWQPVGMDISADNLAAVILTYRAVYYYTRQPDQDWFDALNTRPRRVSIGNFRNAEAIAFGDERNRVIVTGENKHSAVLLIDFSEDSAE